MAVTRGAKNRTDDGAENVDAAIDDVAIVSPIFKKPQEMMNLIDFVGSGGRRRKTKKSNTTLESPVPQNMNEEFTLCREISPVNLLKVGCRIDIFWPLDNIYYQGCVKNISGKIFCILYDDNLTENLELENELWRYPVRSASNPKLIVMLDECDEKIDDNRHVILHLADVKKGISKNCVCKECAEYWLRKMSTDFLKYCDERDQFFKELVDNVEGI